jgi:hypothetical protein
VKICVQACYQGLAYYAFTGFRILHYETWLIRFLESKIYFKGHFGHEGRSESKIEGPKKQNSYDLRLYHCMVLNGLHPNNKKQKLFFKRLLQNKPLYFLKEK